MSVKQLHIELLSDATFGRGDGVAGLVDQEIEHDAYTGLPFVRGRTIKGLLVEECANLLYALPNASDFHRAAQLLFGAPGSQLQSQAHLHISNAMLPKQLRDAIRYEIEEANTLKADEVLEALTGVRRQTSVDEQSGVPDEGSLRAMRVLLRGTRLSAELHYHSAPDIPDETVFALLAACVASWRRGGTGRNRGRGRLRAYLDSEKVQQEHIDHFKQLLKG